MARYNVDLTSIFNRVSSDAVSNGYVNKDELCSYEIVIPILNSPRGILDVRIPDDHNITTFTYKKTPRDRAYAYRVPAYKGDEYTLLTDFHNFAGDPNNTTDIQSHLNLYHRIILEQVKRHEGYGGQETLRFMVYYRILAKGEKV